VTTVWIEDAAGWLAIGLYRAAMRRIIDGRLPDDTRGSAAGRLVELDRAWRDRAAAVRATYDRDLDARRLAVAFGLGELELDLLGLASAAQRETALLPALAALRPPGVEAALHAGLLAELATADREAEQAALAALASDAVLGRWQLLRFGVGLAHEAPFVARAVDVPQRVVAAAIGDLAVATPGVARLATRVDAAIQTVVRELPADGDPRSTTSAYVLGRAALISPATVLVLAGPPGAGRARMAAALAAEHGLVVLELALHLAPEDGAPLESVVRIAARDARLRCGLLAFAGLDQQSPEQRARKLDRALRVLDALGSDDPVIVLGGDRDALRASPRDVVWVEVAPPGAEDRVQLLTAALAGAATALDDAQLASIAGSYPLSPDGIEAAARDARRAALARTGLNAGRVDPGDLVTACRAQLEHRMTSLADPVRSRVRFDDLVVDAELATRLREMISYVRHAETVYDRWGFGARATSRGVAALFSGPPGTGKTMAASVIATELGLELFRIDLSRIVSKYIGETESNVSRVFTEAAHSRAILLFDEADSLFGKRTDVKSSVDRYANMEVNHLLQRMEAFDGISILTTNLEAAIDEAFRRRLQFRLRFDPPDAAMRERLWRTIIPAAARVESVDFRTLAARFDISGGYIRNVAVRAAFTSASERRGIAMRDLVDAAEREVEEMGRVTQRRLA
jgi:AAA+ superfamily predicted ATPase